MRRHPSCLTSLCAIAALAGGGRAQGAPAQEPQRHDAGQLTLKRVTMLRAGIGYFELEGRPVDGELALEVDADALDDVLKSLVVRDARSGAVTAIEFPAGRPVDRLLESLAIDIRRDPSFATLLREIRGMAVTVEAVAAIDGRILGIEQKSVVEDGAQTTRDHLLLLTDDGVRSIPLDTVREIRLHDERAIGDLRRALAALASRYGSGERLLRMRLKDAPEQVRVGFVREVPVWKAAWRLVIPAEGEASLRGWAIVDNVSTRDWQDVELTLASGRPISFVMPLHEPIHLQRPIIQPELHAGLEPKRHEQALVAETVPARPEGADARERAARRGRAGPTRSEVAAARGDDEAAGLAFAGRAIGEEVGGLFRYRIEEPVTLARHRSAMLPLIEAEVAIEPLSLFDPQIHRQHPVRAARVRNRSELDLVNGPVTVYAGGEYAGEALLPMLPAGASRLISYALDLEVEVLREEVQEPRSTRSLRIVDGVLHATHRIVRVVEFTIRNSAREARHVLVEVERSAGWEVAEPQPVETTRDAHRFAADVPAHESKTLAVRLQDLQREQIVLSDAGIDHIRLLLDAPAIGDEVKAALQQLVQRQRRIDELRSRVSTLQAEVQAIVDDQQRIRGNLSEVGKDTELYARYLEKLGQQEDTLETLRAQVSEVRAELDAAQGELRTWLAGLSIG